MDDDDDSYMAFEMQRDDDAEEVEMSRLSGLLSKEDYDKVECTLATSCDFFKRSALIERILSNPSEVSNFLQEFNPGSWNAQFSRFILRAKWLARWQAKWKMLRECPIYNKKQVVSHSPRI